MPLVSQGNSVDSKHEEVVVINESNERESSMSRQRNTLLDQIHKFNFEQQEIAIARTIDHLAERIDSIATRIQNA
jgi:replication-associated recombination protein RarA